ncbi:hypothetical protein QYM36_015167 [Artemia franciscana]|uniref:Uncharacterized protein n=1 Tax=Artemia franciscana TaxID=6661 RepID=A0AA88HHZ0_ARTSF|nr:hypothetical protein QYM36_015167 [Artemia franciscana]
MWAWSGLHNVERFKATEMEAAKPIASCLSEEHEKEILENRQYIKALLKPRALLRQQDLVFCGHDEGEASANQGNFVVTVHPLMEINPDLMKNSRKAYGHYMSQNMHVTHKVLAVINPLSETLQAADLVTQEASILISATKNKLRKIRDDEYFSVLYSKSKEMAINVRADLLETSALSSAIPAKSK